ncbi:ABC transporter ATP-binding protein [Desulfosarcina ovata]|uniref:Nickel import system ATP-binding protein NikD n=1 Tax=Desulfosarcina ovata subsp. ovata TaxID=2752305 RepID=A0A5K8AAW3_9BACT|nr:ABC transporter ATP-binding protein [Desulfosarcina ovata]BBO89656.1 dipeptide transport ATP-binding protein DppD [Desulfosarcina ovata subsp. ovata]
MRKDPVVLDVRQLQVSFTTSEGCVRALAGVSFQVGKGEVFAIAGESGAGKSVVCRSIVNRLEPSASVAGEIWFDNQPILDLGKSALRRLYAREIAVLPQHTTALNPLMSIGEHLSETLRAHFPKMKKKTLRDRSIHLLETFGLKEAGRVYRAYPYQLSGGMQQRVLIALAYCCDPVLVVADEPTKALDPVLKETLLETLLEIKASRRVSMVLVTHDLTVAHRLADHVGILYHGRFLEKGGSRQVLEQSAHPYTAMLIHAMPENGLAPDLDENIEATQGEPHDGCPFQPRCQRGKDDAPHPYAARKIDANHTVWCTHAGSQ